MNSMNSTGERESRSDALRGKTRNVAWALSVAGLLAGAGWLWAGDPIPDLDVILEQVLGFDSVRLSGDKALKNLSLVDLPTGWGLRPDGKRLILSGPRVAPPVRFRLETDGARPEQVSVELLAGKKVLFSRMNINPRIVPRRVVAGTVSGTVRLPPRSLPLRAPSRPAGEVRHRHELHSQLEVFLHRR